MCVYETYYKLLLLSIRCMERLIDKLVVRQNVRYFDNYNVIHPRDDLCINSTVKIYP